jgi:CheY-like chemotaxis protein
MIYPDFTFYTMRSIIVAVADDDITHYLMLKTIISRLPLITTIMHFADGKELYDFINKNSSNQNTLPDYIFLDIYMPKMDGWEFLEKLGEMEGTLAKKISVFINSGSNEHKQRAIKHPLVKDYLRKPISESQIQGIFAEVSQ